MTIGLDVSQAVYGTGVSDYTINLFQSLKTIYSKDKFIPIGFSLRRQQDIKKLFPDSKVFPIPPAALDKMWNRLHIGYFETFSGEIDIYHSSDWTQAPSKSKKITTIHDLAPIIYPSEHDPEIVSVHRRRLSWVVSECDAVICVSQNTANDFIRLYNYPKEKVSVIHEGLPARFKMTPRKNDQGEYILAIGARQPRKNIQRLISAHQKYAKKHGLPKLIVVGENNPNITVQASSTNGLQFTGYVSDQKLVDLLAHAKCFVYPSMYEGFGLPILGAFYHQVPVACSDIPVFREIAGVYATYFYPNSEEDMTIGISKAISSGVTGLSQLKKYSWDSAAKETYKIYQKLC